MKDHEPRRAELLAALHEDEADVRARIARLERVLEFDRVAAHVRSAVDRAAERTDPLPHVWIPALLPADSYAALIDAIPAPVFFEACELRVPPRLAPTHCLVAWAFLNEVVLHVVSPSVVARLREPLAAFVRSRFPDPPPLGEGGAEIALSEGRILMHGGAGAPVPPADRPWDFLTGLICLAPPGEPARHGIRLRGEAFPFQPNSALIFMGQASDREYAFAAGSSAYTYEFGIGPTRRGRRLFSTYTG